MKASGLLLLLVVCTVVACAAGVHTLSPFASFLAISFEILQELIFNPSTTTTAFVVI